MALVTLLESGALDGRFYQPAAENEEWGSISDCVVALAAKFPLNECGKFNQRDFLVSLEEAP
jgi:hypothetical protein